MKYFLGYGTNSTAPCEKTYFEHIRPIVSKENKVFNSFKFLFSSIYSNSVCGHCEKSFKSQQGLDNHQSRDNAENYGCHRLQKQTQKNEILQHASDRKNLISQTRLRQNQPDVSIGPHPSGSPLHVKDKRSILNLYQSYINDGFKTTIARSEVAKRL